MKTKELSDKQKEALKARILKLEDQRERNVDRYILPIESKLAKLRDKLEGTNYFQ